MAGFMIESPEAQQFALAIASHTGKRVTDVVTDALRGEFERLPKKREGKASLEELLAIADRIAALDRGPKDDHGEWLYDENGLPT
jgi:antitoxin VapB